MYDTDALTPSATIPQRLDRLPLTWTLWRLALVTQAGWGFVVATDAIAARIYPFVWGPRHAFDTAAFPILLLVSTGAGIVAGEYLFAPLARTPRRARAPVVRAGGRVAACGAFMVSFGEPGGFQVQVPLQAPMGVGTDGARVVEAGWVGGFGGDEIAAQFSQNCAS